MGNPDGVRHEDAVWSLSPSRAADFLTCALLYRFRVWDRLPEPPSPHAVRGTVVHRVLEWIFERPASERTEEVARSLVEPAWDALRTAEPALEDLFTHDPTATAEWLDTCEASVSQWFGVEDPTRLEPAERETPVEATLESGLVLRGIIDRVDVAPDGAIRIVDYKTGRAPGRGFESSALFQLRFYALVLWLARGEVPRMLRLVYLGSSEVIAYEPDEADLIATRRKVEAIGTAIRTAQISGQWEPQPGRPCSWCAHRSICPAWGGQPPPLPAAPGAPRERGLATNLSSLPRPGVLNATDPAG